MKLHDTFPYIFSPSYPTSLAFPLLLLLWDCIAQTQHRFGFQVCFPGRLGGHSNPKSSSSKEGGEEVRDPARWEGEAREKTV